MGGTLELVATFPDTGPVKIVNLGDLEPSDEEEESQEQLADSV